MQVTVRNLSSIDGGVRNRRKVQQKAGQILSGSKQEAKGLAKKIQGKAQKKVGDAKEALKDARSKL